MVVSSFIHTTFRVVTYFLLCNCFAVGSYPYYDDSIPIEEAQPPIPENAPDYIVEMAPAEQPNLNKFRKKMTEWVEEQLLKTVKRADHLQTDLHMLKNNANHQEDSIRTIKYKMNEIEEEFSEVNSKNDDTEDELDELKNLNSKEALRVAMILDQQNQINEEVLTGVKNLQTEENNIKATQEIFRGTLTESTDNIEELQNLLLDNSATIENNTNLFKLESLLLNSIVNDTKSQFKKNLALQENINSDLIKENLKFQMGLEKLERENSALRTQLGEVQIQSAVILEENENIRQTNLKILSENKEIEQNYQQSIKKFNENHKEFEQIKEQNDNITAENNNIKTEYMEISKRVEQTLEENANLKRENTNIISLNRVLQDTVSKNIDILKDVTTEIKSLNNHVLELDRSSQLLISENYKTDSEITGLSTKLSEIDDFNSKIEPRIANVEQNLTILQDQSSEIQNAYGDVTKKVSENRRQFNISLNELINSVNVKNGEIVESVEDFQDVLMQTVGENLRLKNNISTIIKNYTSIKLNNKAIKEELEFVELKLSKSRTEKNAIESNLKQLQTNFTEIAKENKIIKNKIFISNKSLHPTTCEEVLLGNPGAETGLYTIFQNEEDNTGFEVKCEFSARSVKQVFFGRSCTELKTRSPENENGVYKVFPSKNISSSISVYCQGPWTVFQKRFDGSQNFNQNFTTYETGFGNLDSEHWLGLLPLHELTKNGNHILRVEMEDFQGNEAYAEYQDFRIEKGPGYVFRIGKYSGTAGNSLSAFTNKRKFSTPDRDQDRWRKKSCAVVRTGAFWWDRCGFANPNSWTYDPEEEGYHMYWYRLNRDYTPLKAMTWMFKSS